MAETTIDPAQADTARSRAAEEPGPISANLGTIVTRAARRFGAKTALIAPGRALTYAELDDLCDRVAGGLRDIGVRPRDRVSLYSPNRWEWVVAYHAALRAGAVVNPINVMLTAEARPPSGGAGGTPAGPGRQGDAPGAEDPRRLRP